MECKKEKLLVYPYDSHFCPVMRHESLLEGYIVHKVASPPGFGLCGKDAGTADGGGHTGLKVEDGFDDLLQHVDTVLFSQCENEMEFDSLIYPKILKAIEAGKNLLCTIRLRTQTYRELRQLTADKGVKFLYYNAAMDSQLFKKLDFDKKIQEQGPEAKSYDTGFVKEALSKINVPVIFVLGLSERTNKFEMQLSLREKFGEMGYKVGQVGTRSYCELLGFHSMPDFMYSTAISEYDKIILFNRFIKTIELDEMPDVILIGIPGGVMPMNSLFNNRFGMLAHEIAYAVTADVSILSILYEDYESEFFDRISSALRYKFNVEVSGFNLSNRQFNWSESRQRQYPTYTTLSTEFADKKKADFGMLSQSKPIFNALNSQDMTKMAGFLIDRLAEYGEMGAL